MKTPLRITFDIGYIATGTLSRRPPKAQAAYLIALARHYRLDFSDGLPAHVFPQLVSFVKDDERPMMRLKHTHRMQTTMDMNIK